MEGHRRGEVKDVSEKKKWVERGLARIGKTGITGKARKRRIGNGRTGMKSTRVKNRLEGHRRRGKKEINDMTRERVWQG